MGRIRKAFYNNVQQVMQWPSAGKGKMDAKCFSCSSIIPVKQSSWGFRMDSNGLLIFAYDFVLDSVPKSRNKNKNQIRFVKLLSKPWTEILICILLFIAFLTPSPDQHCKFVAHTGYSILMHPILDHFLMQLALKSSQKPWIISYEKGISVSVYFWNLAPI